MASTSLDQSAEITALRARVAQLEAELACGHDFISSLDSSGDFVRRHLQGLGVGIALFTTDWRQVPFLSVTAEIVLGLTHSQLRADPAVWLQSIVLQDAALFQAAVSAALAGTSAEVTYRIVRADGQRWIHSRVSLAMASIERPHLLMSFEDVTQRTLAEEALRESEACYRRIVETATDGIVLIDAELQFSFVNARMAAILKLAPDEMVGKQILDFFGPAEVQRLRDAMDRRKQGISECYQMKARAADGEERWLRITASPLFDKAGCFLSSLAMVSDITEQTRAEEQLRASEERYRLLAEHSTDMISKHAVDGTVLYVSPAIRLLLGYEPEELFGKSPLEFIHPDDLAGIYKSGESGFNPQGFAAVAYRVFRKDGECIWFETTYKMVPGPESGGPHEVLAVSRDVTVRRQAAEQLSDSEARLRSILNTVADGIITVNESGIIEQFNPGAERLFGYAAAEVLGQHVRMLMPAAVAAYFQGDARRRSAYRGLLSRAREVDGRHKDGTRRELEMRVGETEIAGRRIYTAILHDISERKRTQRMLSESEKLAATGRIAARIAHEINNPLAGIRNSFLLIEDAIPRDHPYFGYLARIESEIDRIARIVRQMFDLYRPDHVTRRSMELDRTIRDVVALLGTVAPARKVTLAVETAGAGGAVRLPEDSLRQVLYNVIVNAIEASPEGGLVKIKAALRDDVVEVLVSDSGEGIPTELRSQIYEPFFTTKSLSGTGGLGLGLSISRGIVEAMRGTLDFESIPGHGTVFRVRISVRDQEIEVAHA